MLGLFIDFSRYFVTVAKMDKDCRLHAQQIQALQFQIEKLEDMVKEYYKELKAADGGQDMEVKERIIAIEEKIRRHKKFVNEAVEKLNGEIKDNVAETQSIKESVIEIKNTVASGNEKTAILFAQVTKSLNDIETRKKEYRQGIVFPIVTQVIGWVLLAVAAYLAGGGGV